MKHLFTVALLLPLMFAKVSAQSDTLHIYYSGLSTKILDSNDTKIGKWAKSLNGKKMDVQVLAYYNDKGLKEYSQQRADELFLVLNRKAREQINITFIGPAKGQKSQRSKVDIVYTPQGQSPQPAVKAVPVEKSAPVEKPAAADKPQKTDVAKTEPKKEDKPEKKAGKPEAKEKKVTETKKEKKQDAPSSPAQETTASSESPNATNGLEELNSAPTVNVSETEPLKVMVNGEWVEYQDGKKVKKKKKD